MEYNHARRRATADRNSSAHDDALVPAALAPRLPGDTGRPQHAPFFWRVSPSKYLGFRRAGAQNPASWPRLRPIGLSQPPRVVARIPVRHACIPSTGGARSRGADRGCPQRRQISTHVQDAVHSASGAGSPRDRPYNGPPRAAPAHGRLPRGRLTGPTRPRLGPRQRGPRGLAKRRAAAGQGGRGPPRARRPAVRGGALRLADLGVRRTLR